MRTLGQEPSLWDQLKHMILPVTVLAVSAMAPLARYARSSMLEVLREEVRGLSGQDQPRYLGSLDVVRGLRLSRVLPDAVVFHVATRGGVEALRRELEGGGRLRPVDASAASPTYAWQP